MSTLPLDAYYDLTQVNEVAVAPAGDRVAFTATEYDQSADEAVGHCSSSRRTAPATRTD